MVIKPINISNLKTTKEIEFKCKNCGLSGEMYFENLIIDVDNEETIRNQLRGLTCYKCGKDLLDDVILK
jgi:DNA-directed RNA polymerase subunit M/transcription elongation factor TFIIS